MVCYLDTEFGKNKIKNAPCFPAHLESIQG